MKSTTKAITGGPRITAAVRQPEIRRVPMSVLESDVGSAATRGGDSCLQRADASQCVIASTRVSPL